LCKVNLKNLIPHPFLLDSMEKVEDQPAVVPVELVSELQQMTSSPFAGWEGEETGKANIQRFFL
jgi:hypothetical protein